MVKPTKSRARHTVFVFSILHGSHELFVPSEVCMKRSISFRTFTTSCFAGFLLVVQLAGAQLSNFDACKLGFYSCDRSRLTNAELARVAESDHQRNFDACKFGFYSCDRSRLTTAELAVVAESDHQRNFDACKSGLYLAILLNLVQRNSIRSMPSRLRQFQLHPGRVCVRRTVRAMAILMLMVYPRPFMSMDTTVRTELMCEDTIAAPLGQTHQKASRKTLFIAGLTTNIFVDVWEVQN